MKAKDTLLLNKTTTQNPILARRAWFWHVASQLCHILFKALTFRQLSQLFPGALVQVKRATKLLIIATAATQFHSVLDHFT